MIDKVRFLLDELIGARLNNVESAAKALRNDLNREERTSHLANFVDENIISELQEANEALKQLMEGQSEVKTN